MLAINAKREFWLADVNLSAAIYGGGAGAGTGSNVETPTVPEVPTINTNDTPSSPSVSDGQNGSEIGGSNRLNTLDADIQKLITRASQTLGQAQPNASFTAPKSTTPAVQSKAPVSAAENRINISPEAVDIFDLEQNEIIF